MPYLSRICLLLFSLLLPLSAAHADLSNQDRTILIGNINKALADFAKGSGIKITYDDIVYYDEPMYGAYLSFVKPKITVSYGATYEFSARNLALKEDGEGVMRLSLPSHLTMRQIRGQQINNFQVTLNGVPSLRFRVNDSLMINHYQVSAPEAFSLRFKHAASGAIGTIAFRGNDIETKTWKAINPLKQEDVTGFIDRIGLAFKE